MKKKVVLWTAVFTNYQIVGWYTVGSYLSKWQADIHASVDDYSCNRSQLTRLF